MTWVKICGMTNLEDARYAVDAGADAVGFVFYEKSQRCVTVEAAREISAQLPGRVDKVGVFVNEPPDRVAKMAEAAKLTAVQLHGDEYKNPEAYDTHGKVFFMMPMVKVLRDLRGQSGFYGFPKLPAGSAVLLDSGSQEQPGGTGKTFAWGEGQQFISALKRFYPVIIAGGLTSSNVGWAAELLKPWGVDVSSGVEASPGKKDPEKVRAFMQAVREYDRKAG
jgi:phosphoribosylanthranilate isomerase